MIANKLSNDSLELEILDDVSHVIKITYFDKFPIFN